MDGNSRVSLLFYVTVSSKYAVLILFTFGALRRAIVLTITIRTVLV